MTFNYMYVVFINCDLKYVVVPFFSGFNRAELLQPEG